MQIICDFSKEETECNSEKVKKSFVYFIQKWWFAFAYEPCLWIHMTGLYKFRTNLNNLLGISAFLSLCPFLSFLLCPLSFSFVCNSVSYSYKWHCVTLYAAYTSHLMISKTAHFVFFFGYFLLLFIFGWVCPSELVRFYTQLTRIVA